MSSTVRFVLAAAVAVLVVALAGAAALVWPFLDALRVSPAEAWEALWR